MFINTSNRLTRFYTTNKTAIDTLLQIVQLIAMAIALLTLLAILGWALAISQAVAWMNQLVEDSLKPQRLLRPAVDMLDTKSNDGRDAPNTDTILAEWRERAALTAPFSLTSEEKAALPQLVNQVAPQKENATAMHLLTIRELKKLEARSQIIWVQ